MEGSASTGNIHVTEDEEYSGDSSFNRSSGSARSLDFHDRRRSIRKTSEQQRRDNLKAGYETLRGLVPTCQTKDPNAKMSQYTVLQKSIDYMTHLIKEQKKSDEERISLQKEVLELRIIKAKLQQVPGNEEINLSNDVKFQVFKAIMDEMFASFDKLSMNDFGERAGGVINWMEEYCNPEKIQKVVDRALAHIKSDHGAQPSTSKGEQP